ncbi:MAG TPA: outer membrane protein [Pseudorhizobium sp.]|nr:outer membrane protein [Pseudorhizobium sp.]
MKRLRALIIATGLSCQWCGIAAATDDPVLLDAPEISIESGKGQSGWYLRGDLGYPAWRSEGSPDFAGSAGGQASFDDNRFGRPFSGSLGIGYRINDLFRTDLTGDYFAADMGGEFSSSQPCAGSPANTACAYDGSADVRTYGLMLNGYVDLANIAGFTPYVGAGLGATRMVWDDFAADSACVGTACSTGSAATFEGESSWRFSYALMAGVTYAITERVKLDLGYRYSDIAGGPMFRSNQGQADDDGLRRHEVRLGLQVGF